MHNTSEKSPLPSKASLNQTIIDLGSEDYVTRQTAREKLVLIGKPAIDFLAELITHPKQIYRLEAVKTLMEINDPLAIPLFLEICSDDDPDIRWIAAEGLIKQGPVSFIPVLKMLTKDSDSIYIREGAYHILHHLRTKFPARDKLQELLNILEKNDQAVYVSALAEELIELVAK